MRVRNALTLTAAALVSAWGLAAPVSAAEPVEWRSDPPIIWIDPTDGLDFSVEYFVDPMPEGAWVVGATAPNLVKPDSGHSVIQCTVAKTPTGATLSCAVLGEFEPKEGNAGVARVRFTVEGIEYVLMDVPIVICPPTGCASYFELALAESSMTVCAGEDLAAVEPNSYVFNVPWNAQLAQLGTIDGDPGADWEFLSAPPADGSVFEFRGWFSNPGEYTLPITVTDEFGTPHTAELELIVEDCGPAASPTAAPAPRLAATGTDHLGRMLPLAVGLGAAGLGAVGLAFLIAATRLTRRAEGRAGRD